MSSNIGINPYEHDLFSNLQADWEIEPYYYDGVVPEAVRPGQPGFSLNPSVMIVVLAVVVGFMLTLMASSLDFASTPKETVAVTAVPAPQSPAQTGQTTFPTDSLTIIAPYKNYALTQGIHGMSYGHMAIDIAAGRGEPIMAPINGTITQKYMDEYGNPTLVIENDVYAVTFLHGDYSAAAGETFKIGQQIGTESNHGYTMDMAGNLCYDREWCGNHTHLNVFDKRIQANVNPLTLIGG